MDTTYCRLLKQRKGRWALPGKTDTKTLKTTLQNIICCWLPTSLRTANWKMYWTAHIISWQGVEVMSSQTRSALRRSASGRSTFLQRAQCWQGHLPGPCTMWPMRERILYTAMRNQWCWGWAFDCTGSPAGVYADADHTRSFAYRLRTNNAAEGIHP